MATYYKGDEFKKNLNSEQWYTKDVVVTGPARDLFENYSHIPADRVVQHVSDVRDRAFKNMPYACIGTLRFLNLSLSKHPLYSSILSRLSSPQSTWTLLDLGCCFGQDIRKLVHDGALSSHLHGIDIDAAFIDFGYDLFLDRDTLKSTFSTADLFHEPSADLLEKIGGGVDIVNAASFYHLFNWEQQIHLAKNVIRLLKPVRGAMLLGRQVGSITPGEYPQMKKDGTTTYWHDVGSWERLWKEVGEATKTCWTVDASLDEEEFGYGQNQWGDPSMRRLLFAIYRQ